MLIHAVGSDDGESHDDAQVQSLRGAAALQPVEIFARTPLYLLEGYSRNEKFKRSTKQSVTNRSSRHLTRVDSAASRDPSGH